MDALKTFYEHGFAARIGALEAAEHGLKNKSPEAIETIRRITRSLYFTRDAYDNAEATKVILALEETEDAELPASLRALLPRLRELTSTANAKKIGILIAEDDPFTSEMLEKGLRGPGRAFFSARTVAEAEKIIEEEEIDLVLLDIVLLESDGRDLLARLRERFPGASLPILVLSGKDDPRVQSECFALGADGYFAKTSDMATLSAAISSNLQRAADYTRRSTRDFLTGLPNREAFVQAFDRAKALASRKGEPLALAILDIDRFKSVNDLYGHSTGDLALQRACGVLSRSLRASDFLARWGGEEFVILFPNTDLFSARQALGKALKSLREESFEAKDGKPFSITFSAGIASVGMDDAVEESLIKADKLLFTAKALGRNQVIITDDLRTKARQKALFIGGGGPTASEIRGLLERIGFDAVHADDPAKAFDAASNGSLSLIILDVGFRKIDGFELLKTFRKTPAFAQVPILILTNRKGRYDVVRAFQLGANDCASRPIVHQELSARILRLLK